MQILNWLSLKNTSGVGPYLFKKLIEKFNSPDKVFDSGLTELLSVKGISEKTAHNILNKKVTDFEKKDLEITLKNNCNIITMTDADYPELLKEIHDPPPLLYVAGKLFKDNAAIAVVGSRSATSYGIKNAEEISYNISKAGIEIVSGMARGIDTAAHNGALNANGRTIAVLGGGLGNIYPKENTALAYKISEKGAVISEFSFHAPPEPHNFPMRNRIISGLSLGTLVIEAAKKSGSLITARTALEQNRDVFAMPGSVSSAKSSGTHFLLKQGAKLVETAEDIVDEYIFTNKNKTLNTDNSDSGDKTINEICDNQNFDLDFEELSVLKVLDSYPVHIDEIHQKTSINMGRLAGILINLELKNFIQQTPGKYFSICEGNKWQNH